MKPDDREHLRGMSDSAPLFALIIVAGAIGCVIALIGGLWFALH
jgi:hypothetical protein